jgi:peptide deformylase
VRRSNKMAKLPICYYPDKVLRYRAAEVGIIDDNIKQLINDMIDTMDAEGGIGLAAPQVGESVRVIVVKIEGGYICLVNPKIVRRSGNAIMSEGCLSLPNIYVEVKRPVEIEISGWDRMGDVVKVTARDIVARALCHETDHLNGRLIIDYASHTERKRIKPALTELEDKYKRTKNKGL